MNDCYDYIFLQMFQMQIPITKDNLMKHYGMNKKTALAIIKKWEWLGKKYV